MRIALLENIHARAVDLFTRAGFDAITSHAQALEGDALNQIVNTSALLGIRSKTHLAADNLETAPSLRAVGCFCIGTDQVDLTAAALRGIPVFNAPYANTRSVAELVLAEIIMLMRRIPQKNARAHRGEWLKAVDGACEVRGKTLGIIGYGHIGTQLGILAEALGMRVIFTDILEKLALGNAQKAESLNHLLVNADAVSLHVPATPETTHMIAADQLAVMKPGAVLVNASRGKVVDLEALAAALKTGAIAGAAIDVFPIEPAAKGDVFVSPLQGLENVILTPHIGGSTLEAQENIAAEVAEKMIRYIQYGDTMGAVNFPNLFLSKPAEHVVRFRHIHANVPGVLARMNDVFSSHGLNVTAQMLQTDSQIGYAVTDCEHVLDAERVRLALGAIPATIRCD